MYREKSNYDTPSAAAYERARRNTRLCKARKLAGRAAAARPACRIIKCAEHCAILISLRLQHVRFTGSLPAAEGSGPPSYFPRTSYLSNFMISGACERGEFYCEINFSAASRTIVHCEKNFFSCEWNFSFSHEHFSFSRRHSFFSYKDLFLTVGIYFLPHLHSREGIKNPHAPGGPWG